MKFRKKGTALVLMLLVAGASAWMFDTNVRYGNVTITGNLRGGTNGVVGFTNAADPGQIALDGGFSRCGANTLCLGNGTAGNASGTLKLLNLQQGTATGPFSLVDNLGVGHFFVSGISPYTNTFISGNGSGIVLLGSAGKTTFSDTLGGITMFGTSSGQTFLQPSAVASGTLTLPAATDTLVGKATTDTLTNKTLTSPGISGATLTGGVGPDGSGYKHKRFGTTCTTSAVPFSQCATTFSWTTAFADANYTPTCTPGPFVGNVGSMYISSFNAAGVTVTIESLNSAGAAISISAVYCTGTHD